MEKSKSQKFRKTSPKIKKKGTENWRGKKRWKERKKKKEEK